MANEIKQLFSSINTLTIELRSLASSTSYLGRQSTLVDNSSNRYQKILIFVKVKCGTNAGASRGVYVNAIRGNGIDRDDIAGASDASWLAKGGCQLLGTLVTTAATASAEVLQGSFILEDPGKEWGIGIYHDTGQPFTGVTTENIVSWYGINPEIQ